MAEAIKGQAALRRRLRALQNPRQFLAKMQLDTVYQTKATLDGRYGRRITRSGNLSRSVRAGFLTASYALVKVNARYAAFVEFGTGIYGPRRRPIVPKRAKALRFPASGVATTLGGRVRNAAAREAAASGRSPYQFARSVKGREATPYLAPAVKRAARQNGLPDVAVDLWNRGA